MTAKKPPEEHLPAGRPTKYEGEKTDKTVYKLALWGAIDTQIAEIIGVDKATLNRWKSDHPSFRDSLKKGKLESDSEIVKTLRQRALGYEVDDIKMSAQGDVVHYDKHVPPDVTALIFWLKNRQPREWRDKQELEHSGAVHIHFDEQDRKLIEGDDK
jgi:hypothetical protein